MKYNIDKILIILFSPPILVLFFLVSIMILIFIGMPIIYKQNRPGKNGLPFKFYKFRTMTNTKNIEGKLLPDEERLTRFGIFLRNTSIDEIPSLFNVLKGDMSLVGPRPLLIEYLKHYTNFQNRRHEVKPSYRLGLGERIVILYLGMRSLN